MLDKERATGAAEALMSGRRAGQATALQRELTRQRQVAMQKCAALFGLPGTFGGALIGHTLFDNWPIGASIGLAVGMAVGSYVGSRRA